MIHSRSNTLDHFFNYFSYFIEYRALAGIICRKSWDALSRLGNFGDGILSYPIPLNISYIYSYFLFIQIYIQTKWHAVDWRNINFKSTRLKIHINLNSPLSLIKLNSCLVHRTIFSFYILTIYALHLWFSVLTAIQIKVAVLIPKNLLIGAQCTGVINKIDLKCILYYNLYVIYMYRRYILTCWKILCI